MRDMMGDTYGDAQDFYLTPGDTMTLEYKYMLDGQAEATIGTFSIMSSEKCVVVYTPIHPERFALMRHSTLNYYKESVLRAAEQNDGKLSISEIENVFKKEEFYNKLRHETE